VIATVFIFNFLKRLLGCVLQEAAQDLLCGDYSEGAIWQNFEEGPESQAGGVLMVLSCSCWKATRF